MEEVLSGGFQTRTEGPCKRDAYNSAKTISKSQWFFQGTSHSVTVELKKINNKKKHSKVQNAECLWCNRSFSIYYNSAWLRGHKQRKLNDHVYSLLSFVSSEPHCQAEF